MSRVSVKKMKKILNQQDMRDINLNSVLRLIRRTGPLTRRQIEGELNLSWGTVSGATATLLQGGYIKEVKAAGAFGAGRTPTALAIHPDTYVVLGLDVNRSGLTGVVLNLAGETLLCTKADPTATDRDGWLDEIHAMLDRLLHFAAKHGRPVLAVGIAMQGAVDAKNGIAANFPAKGWQDLPLCEALAQKYALPFYLEHDPDCILYAAAGNEARDAVLLRVDKGIGMAVMLEGKLLKRFGAFELGFTLQNGRPLEESTTTRGLAAKAGGDFAKVVAAAEGGDPAACALFDTLAEDLGTAVANVAELFHVSDFLLCGKMMACKALFWEKLTATACRRRTLTLSTTDVAQAAVGAALLAAERHSIQFE